MPESLQQLVEVLKNPGANANVFASVTIGKEDKTKQFKDKKVRGISMIRSLLLVISCNLFSFFYVEIGSWPYRNW